MQRKVCKEAKERMARVDKSKRSLAKLATESTEWSITFFTDMLTALKKLFILVDRDRSFLYVALPTGVQLVFLTCSGFQ